MGTGLPIVLGLKIADEHVVLVLIVVIRTTIVGSGGTVVVLAGFMTLQNGRIDLVDPFNRPFLFVFFFTRTGRRGSRGFLFFSGMNGCLVDLVRVNRRTLRGRWKPFWRCWFGSLGQVRLRTLRGKWKPFTRIGYKTGKHISSYCVISCLATFVPSVLCTNGPRLGLICVQVSLQKSSFCGSEFVHVFRGRVA
jgi:hypothetical protein